MSEDPFVLKSCRSCFISAARYIAIASACKVVTVEWTEFSKFVALYSLISFKAPNHIKPDLRWVCTTVNHERDILLRHNRREELTVESAMEHMTEERHSMAAIAGFDKECKENDFEINNDEVDALTCMLKSLLGMRRKMRSESATLNDDCIELLK